MVADPADAGATRTAAARAGVSDPSDDALEAETDRESGDAAAGTSVLGPVGVAARIAVGCAAGVAVGVAVGVVVGAAAGIAGASGGAADEGLGIAVAACSGSVGATARCDPGALAMTCSYE
jgi:hypothetical protein